MRGCELGRPGPYISYVSYIKLIRGHATACPYTRHDQILRVSADGSGKPDPYTRRAAVGADQRVGPFEKPQSMPVSGRNVLIDACSALFQDGNLAAKRNRDIVFLTDFDQLIIH